MKTLKWFLSIVFLGLMFYLPAAGQENGDDKVYFEVDQRPEYPGGIEKMKQFISENVSYPEEAKKEGIQGRVYVSFTINKKGEVVDTEVAKGVHSTLDAEALRVLESMPKWTPGKKDGRAVNVRATVPVQFIVL
ncbi:MAG: energy transducer TonB [Bacteroidota bacterium]